MWVRGEELADYAIVQTGGKQYRVQPGDTIQVESVSGYEGQSMELDEVLMASQDGNVTLGNPTIQGAKVIAEVVTNGKADKIIVFKYKPKTRYRRKQGHRQSYTELRIIDILL